MDALDIGGLFEWIHGVIEKRWGKLWAWTIYVGLIVSFIASAIWVIARP
jgi:hypothetical protein